MQYRSFGHGGCSNVCKFYADFCRAGAVLDGLKLPVTGRIVDEIEKLTTADIHIPLRLRA